MKISVYRKPTHTDQYLAFESHHPLLHKLSVIRTLFHCAETVVTDPADQVSELDHVKSALLTVVTKIGVLKGLAPRNKRRKPLKLKLPKRQLIKPLLSHHLFKECQSQ